MATIVQRRRGTTAQHAAFTGALGETTFDTDLNRPVFHDGILPGGFPAAMLHVANIFSNQQRITTLADAPQFIITTAPGQTTRALQILQPDGVTQLFEVNFSGSVQVYRQMADTTGAIIDHYKRGDTGDATAPVGAATQLSQDSFRGWDGVDFVVGASIRVDTLEAFTPIARGSEFQFRTVAIGATAQTLVATLNTSAFFLSVPAFISSIANVNALRVLNYSLTGSNAQQLATFAGTWNTTGDPIAIHLNILDTASGALSKLLDLQTNSVSRFSVSKAGDVAMSGSLGTLSGLTLADSALLKWNTRSVISSPADGILRLTNNAENNFTRLALGGTTSAFPAIGRNGINLEILGADGAGPSGLYIYNTKTDATTFERLDIQWTATVARIWTEKGSVGGTARTLDLGTDATTRLRILSSGDIQWGNLAAASSLQTDGSLSLADGDWTINVTAGTLDFRSMFNIDAFAGMLSFFGAAPVVQQDVIQLTNNVGGGGGTPDTIDDFAEDSGNATIGTDLVDISTVPDKATLDGILGLIRGDVAQLTVKISQIITALENYGLFTP